MSNTIPHPALTALILSLALVSGCTTNLGAASSSDAELQKLVMQSEMKPDNISDADIANYLAPKQRVTMWQGPMRIAVEDENGEDLDLTSYPGNFIKHYFALLAAYINFPISITSVDNHDNNVSVVIPIHGAAKRNVGALFGVPELADKSSEFMSGLLKRKPGTSPPLGGVIAESDVEPDSTFNLFKKDSAIKGCVIGISIKHSSEADIHPLWDVIDQFAKGCLGPWLDVRRLPTQRQRLTDVGRNIYDAFNHHSFYLRRVLYGSGLEPGTDAETARHKILEYLSHAQQP